MILTELFDRPVKFRFDPSSTRNHLIYKFQIDGNNYIVNFHRIDDGKGWEIDFGMKEQGSWGTKFSATGGGNEFAVFSTVIDALRDALDRTGARQFIFSAEKEEPTRIKLYDRMMRTKLAKDFHIQRRDFGGDTGFISYKFTLRNDP